MNPTPTKCDRVSGISRCNGKSPGQLGDQGPSVEQLINKAIKKIVSAMQLLDRLYSNQSDPTATWECRGMKRTIYTHMKGIVRVSHDGTGEDHRRRKLQHDQQQQRSLPGVLTLNGYP